MNFFHLRISSPEKKIFDGLVTYCSIFTPTGKRGFEARHEAFVSVLKDNSRISFQPESGESKSVEIQNGLLAFDRNTCTITVSLPAR